MTSPVDTQKRHLLDLERQLQALLTTPTGRHNETSIKAEIAQVQEQLRELGVISPVEMAAPITPDQQPKGKGCTPRGCILALCWLALLILGLFIL